MRPEDVAADYRSGVIGVRIRELRTARSMTVTELARAADVSIGLISQVERGISDPSLETLRRIARVLETPLFNLFAENDGERVAVVRKDARMYVRSPRGEITYQRLSSGSGKIEVLEGRLDPGSASSEEPWSHPSEECVVVLTGTLVVEVEGARHALDTGDSASFDSRAPHRYLNETSEPVRFLLSITPPSF
jgi:transcriptional regulator with XRE-family HTH domain